VTLNPRITDWAGSRVWLVGASTGIGRALALQLHAAGARVIVSARPSAALDELARRCPGLEACPLDVTDRATTQKVADALLAEHGSLDLVLYCAGTYQPQSATAFQLDTLLHHQQVNYVGALHLLAAVLPALLLQARAGWPAHLGLVASVAGYRALPQAMAYGPTKAALIHLAQCLHLELAPLGVGVSLINPGFVQTPLTAQNSFHMPALMTPEAAAQAILRGWARGDFELHFPHRFTRLLKLLQWLPTGCYEWVIRRSVSA
jgi:NAD(P)-dependent dehydrogenase (short-subunit alcohol dehydrogenase family)